MSVHWICESCFRGMYPEGTEETCMGRIAEGDCEECGKRTPAEQLRQPVGYAPRAKAIYAFTPTIDGMISGDTHDSLVRLVHMGVVGEAILHKSNADLVRARSRAVAKFLQLPPKFTHLLFVDADVGFSYEAVRGMMAARVDVIGTPYPKKRLRLDAFKRAIEAGDENADAQLHEWGFRRLKTGLKPTGNIAEVETVAMGLTLISRECLETMTNHFRQTLGFTDHPDMGDSGQQATECVALFMLMLEPSPRGAWLMPEDFSFCHRWRSIGGHVHMYIGPGAPASHWGAFRFSSEAS